jgi:hypothetical protein
MSEAVTSGKVAGTASFATYAIVFKKKIFRQMSSSSLG